MEPELVERVVARLAGGDVAGASAKLSALSADLAEHAAQDVRRLRMHLDARLGRAGAIIGALGRTFHEPAPLAWLSLAVVEGLESKYPVMASLVASLIPHHGAAGRAATRWLVRMATKVGLKDMAATALEQGLGQPWSRFEGIAYDIVARIPSQSEPAHEIERGWLLYDGYGSGAALRAFLDVLARDKPMSDELRCWARIGAVRAAVTRRRFELAGKHIPIAMDGCRGHPELPEAVVRYARQAFVRRDSKTVIEVVSWARLHTPEWAGQHGLDALPVLARPPNKELRALARTVRKRLSENTWFDPVGRVAMRRFSKLRSRGKLRLAFDLLSPLVAAGYRGWRPSTWGQLDYWAARVLWENDKQDQALDRWFALAQSQPNGWYGLLAAAHLRRHRPVPWEQWDAALTQRWGAAPREVHAAAADESLVKRLRSLAEWGLTGAIVEELKAGQVAREPVRAVWASRFLTQAGFPSAGARLAQRAAKLARSGTTADDPTGLWRAAWPMPYSGSLERAIDEVAVSPWFVWAVMRVESLFAPTAKSRAGAQGLLQLMPSTASWLGQRLPTPIEAPNDLFDPPTNILLGAVFLRRLADAYHGSKPLILVAYNAGPGRLKKHIRKVARKSKRIPDVAEFVETLPWDEAKNYVRSVVTSWAMYRAFHGCRCTSSVALELPEKVIARLASKRRRKGRRRR